MSGPEQVPPDAVLLPPCIAAYRYLMNRGQAITLGCRDSEGGGPEPYAACAGTSDPFCEGGSVAWPPDERAKQDEFAMAMAGICTARRWFWRTDNGKTIPIEKLGD